MRLSTSHGRVFLIEGVEPVAGAALRLQPAELGSSRSLPVPARLLYDRADQQSGSEMADSTDNIIVDTATRIFQDLCEPDTINDAEKGMWPKALWDALEESGLTARLGPRRARRRRGRHSRTALPYCARPGALPRRCRSPKH